MASRGPGAGCTSSAIGGAGMSGLALVAHALGAQVTGSDRADSAVPRAAARGGDRPGRSATRRRTSPRATTSRSSCRRPSPPTTPSAPRRPHAGCASCTAASCSRRSARRSARWPSPGRTARRRRRSMAAHALLRMGDGPGVPHRRRAAHDGPQRGLGRGGVARRRGRRVRPLVPAAVAASSRSSRTSSSTTTRPTAPGRRSRRRSASSSPGRGRVIVWDGPDAEAFLDRSGIGEAAFFRADDVVLTPGGSAFTWAEQRVRLSVPGAHNVANAAAALDGVRDDGPPARDAGRDARGLPRRRAPVRGAGQHRVGRDRGRRLRAPPDGGRGDARRRADARARAGSSPSSSRTCTRARSSSPASSARRSRPPTSSASSTIYPAREAAADFPGVSGLAIAEAAADVAARAAGAAGCPASTTREPVLAELLRDGDLCLVLGAGNVVELGRSLVTDPPA